MFLGNVLGNMLERRVQRLEEMEMRNANGLDDWQKPLTWKVVRVDDVGCLMCSGYVEGRSFNTASAFS